MNLRAKLSAETIVYFAIPLIALAFYPWSADVIIIKNLIGYVTITAIVASVLFFRTPQTKHFLTLSPLQIPAILLILHVCISATWSEYPWAFLPELVSVIPCLLLVIVLPITGLSDSFRNNLTRITAISILPVTGYALLQLVGFDPIIWGRPIRDGVFSTFGHPNLLAPFLVIGSAAIIHQINSARRPRMRWFWIIMEIMTVVSFLFTKSKGAFMGLTGGIIFWIILTSSWNRKQCIRWGICVLVMFIVLVGIYQLGFLDGQITTNSFRVWTWKGALSANINAHSGYQSLFGHGPGTFPILFPQFRDPGFLREFRHAENLQHAHCEYLEHLVEYGLLGTLFLLWFIFAYIKLLYTSVKNRTADSLTKLFGIACLSIWIHNLVSVNLQWFSTLFFLYIFSIASIPGSNLLRQTPTRRIRDFLILLIFLMIMTPGLVHLVRQFQSQNCYFKSKMAQASEDLSAARDEINRAVSWNRYNFPAQYDRAYLCAGQGEYSTALNIYRFISLHHPNYQRIHRNTSLVLANLYLKERNPQLLANSISELNTELLINQSEEIYFTLGQLSDLAGDRENMIRSYQGFIRLYLETRTNVINKGKKRNLEDLRLVKPREMDDLKEKFNSAIGKLNREDAAKTALFLDELAKKYGNIPEMNNISDSSDHP